ncbi:TM0106 family RecB-like putative nuclease [Diaphorobacter caeni]|uniref:TM0106 family RecB-like putative nuclease n=1 Tax=Diaphorobacter caeni TaxID=2784387 RepID=UPI001890899C|nr:TM0106 family RecB-like putative nuclease [Diaphorobacter caeni]MBF5007748.1 TM0106 family RecB-like putative nuclease [Diaphorobacter caeni]
MQTKDGQKRFSATDLVNFSACAHLTHLDLLNMQTPLPKAEDPEEMVLIQDKGFAHEARYWEHLKATHNDAIDLTNAGSTDELKFTATAEAMASGAQVVFQATLLEDPWVGHADFLICVDRPSKLGNFSYEVADTKLARSSRAKFLVQLCLYSDMLARVQGVMPIHMHVVLGDGRKETFLVDDYLRYFRRQRTRFLRWTELAKRDTYPEKVERCGQCRWREICSARWEADDHLNRVANISRTQIARLEAAGVDTLEKLSVLPSGQVISRIQPDTLHRLSHQARLQRQSNDCGQPVFEVLPVHEAKGFARLPPPAPGDLFFDMEGDPMTEGGLEYLFGLYYFESGASVFKPFWAHSRAEERLSFEAFMDFVTKHLRRFPSAHIYHYAPYEATAIKRLMSLHGTRETEVDNLLRNATLVDLYAVVREAIRVGEPSYSIKSIERFYSSKERKGDVKTAGASVVFYEKWKTTGDPAVLHAIADYNEDDVRSTFELREWLLSIRPASATQNHSDGAQSADKAQAPVSPKAAAAARLMEEYRLRLLDGLPDDRLLWTTKHRIKELLFHLLSFHRRTEKPVWWALFARQNASVEELLEELEAIAGLTPTAEPENEGDYLRYRYRFPEQETKLKTGDNCTLTHNLQEVLELEVHEGKREVTFLRKLKKTGDDPMPTFDVALGAGLPINTSVIVEAVQRFVSAHLSGDDRFSASLGLLNRDKPKLQGIESGAPLLSPGEDLLKGCIRVVSQLDHSCVFIQGPPGAGKTYTGSHVIVDLLKAGKKVAVTSNSHKAINNLLRGVERVALEQTFSFCGVKKSTSEESCINGQFIRDTVDSKLIVQGIGSFQLVAGTAWLFSNNRLESAFDYLFVDEAGQVSLANLIAMSTCAKNLVLLGDQMQLGQPVQGVHPGESGQSALEYLLQGEATIAEDRGIFLKDTWRMHPDVCQFISDAVYSGRLEAEAGNKNQRLVLPQDRVDALKPTGISFIPAQHDGCSQRSDEEAELINHIYADLLRSRFVDRNGEEHPMTMENILVVAPYNLQVNRLKQVLPAGARVGTVDKFQGQEAEAVLVSMTTSNGEYLPRDIDFLYSKNRLNVAISRARCWVGVVASPALLEVNVNSPVQMALVNTLCWVGEFSRSPINHST